jgi:RNA polymerase sigma factor (TIGR02999 family)
LPLARGRTSLDKQYSTQDDIPAVRLDDESDHPTWDEDVMGDLTQIMDALACGDQQAASQLLPQVYKELRRLAAQWLAHEAPGQTLDPTALVHEAYLRLVGDDPDRPWDNRGHFFAAAAESMRRILVEKARQKRRLKRGGGRARVVLDPALIAAPEASDDLLALDEALTKLAARDPRVAELVSLRYFAGLTNKQAAQALNIAPRTADLHWSYARAWLLAELRREAD